MLEGVSLWWGHGGLQGGKKRRTDLQYELSMPRIFNGYDFCSHPKPFKCRLIPRSEAMVALLNNSQLAEDSV